MESERVVRRRRVGAYTVLGSVVAGLIGVMGPQAGASPVDPGVVGGFEIDGDQDVDGTLDWADTEPTVLIDDVGPDDGLQGSSKEDEPDDYACQDKDPTVTPAKDNIVRAYINTRVTSVDSMFLDLGFVRTDGGTQGDSHMNFEINQNPITEQCPYTGRTDGDLLVTFDFPGNAADPANVQTFKWDSAADDGSDDPGRWISFAFGGAVAADDNVAAIDDEVVGGTIAARAFGEASLDLVAIAQATGATSDGCASFGWASIRSRSSGQSFNSALQDIVGGPVDLTTCGELLIHKTDDAGAALAGATFGLWPAGVEVPAVGEDGNRPSTGSVATCVSADDGTCTIGGVDPGDYQVAEISPPDGYDIDPDVVAVSVVAQETTDVAEAFVDPLDTGSVTITKRLFEDANENGQLDEGEQITPDDLSDLDGITFELQQEGVTATTHPAGTDASCTITGGAGACTISGVKLGTYDIKETLSPTGPEDYEVGASPSVTVDEDDEVVTADYDNPVDTTEVLGVVIVPQLPQTGAGLDRLVSFAATLMLMGVALLHIAHWQPVMACVTGLRKVRR